MSEMSKVEMHLHRILGNIEYTGVEPMRDKDGKALLKDGKKRLQTKENVHLVIYDASVRGGLKEKTVHPKDDTKTVDGKSFPHCSTIPINVAEALTKAASYAVQQGEPEAFAKVMARLTVKNREKRKEKGIGAGSAATAPVFLSPEDDS